MPNNSIQIGVVPIPLVRDATFQFVEWRENWSDEWVRLDYVEPMASVRSIAPSMPRAEFQFVYGENRREDVESGAGFTQEDPLDLRDTYVRIMLTDENGTRPMWHGIITDEALSIHGATDETDPSGIQRFAAYGLEYLLKGVTINTANASSPFIGVANILRAPDFNGRSRYGNSIIGNRTTDVGPDDVHLFSSDGAVWTHKDIMEYLLEYYQPAGVTFIAGGGALETLDKITDVVRVNGLSFYQILNSLIQRQRGLSWRVDVDEDENALIYIESTTAETISVGDEEYVGNQHLTRITLDDAIDIQSAMIKLSSQQRYNRIDIIGGRIKSCFTVSFADGTLEKAWTDDEETAYSAINLSEFQENDAERRTDKHDRVYQAFRIPADWDWVAGSGVGGEGGNANPIVIDNAELTVDTNAPFYYDGRPLLRQIPIEKDAAIDDAQPELLTPIVIIQDSAGDYIQIDKIPKSRDDISPTNVRMMDAEMGVQLNPKINHVLALNHSWNAGTGESFYEPEIDYETIIATVAVEADERIHTSVTIPNSINDATRSLTIHVPDAETWYVVPGTVIGVTNGALVRHEGGTTRDDSDVIMRVAALAKAWYGKERSSISFTVDRVALYLSVGSYVVDVSSSWQRVPIESIVTSIRHDFQRQTTTVTTGFFELDWALVGSGTPDVTRQNIAQVGQGLLSVQRRTKRLEEHVGNIPVRGDSAFSYPPIPDRELDYILGYIDGEYVWIETKDECPVVET